MKFNLFKNKKEIESLRTKLIKQLTYDHGYSLLRSSKTIQEENDFILQLAKQYDEYGYMSEELGMELDGLFEDKDYVIGIHRTGYNDMDQQMIDNIFNKGLINNGHIMQGGMAGNFDIEKTVSIFPDFTVLNGQLKAAHGYKGSQGCIIVKIPKSYLGKSDGPIEPIYYKHDNVTKLLPEFVYGYVPVDKEGRLGDLNRNPNYKDIHNLDNPNLMYEASAVYKAKREGKNLEKQNLAPVLKYQIIEDAYKDTLNKYGNYQAEQALLHLINENEVKYFTKKENRDRLSKYVIYGDVLQILSINNPNMSINEVIQTFMENCNEQEKNSKVR
ncbi:MAG: hypothetical protein IJE04_01645 [Bacilli bacterium]|nr:hypothetical protein [Bacilli bacterium]